jgi:parallel beta-helix repeat protein
VSGTCKENVVIPAKVVKIALDGRGKATIQSVDTAADTIFVAEKNIPIQGFTLTGGRDGIHLSGPAAVVIDGNVIRNNGRGLHLDKGSIGRILNNTIQNNRGVEINLNEHSYARIGCWIPPDAQLHPNTIQHNEGHGIHVGRASTAWIVGNTIANNKGSGIVVNRCLQADIVANTIQGNSGDAISASHNGGVNLQSEGTPRREGPNQTDPALKNGGVGIRCAISGYVDGPLGTLLGTQGAITCIDRLSLP